MGTKGVDINKVLSGKPDSDEIVVNEFTEESAQAFRDKVFESAKGNPQEPIVIYIDSYGGEVYSLLAMISEIEASHKPVATIAIGKAISCGSILLGCGTQGYRFVDPNATIMIHDVTSGRRGKIEEIKASVKQAERLHKTVLTKLAKQSGYKDKDFFLKKITENKHADWYLSPNQAKKLKLVDHIGIPEFKVSLDLNMEFMISK